MERLLVDQVATPPLKVAVPSAIVPSNNVTVPVAAEGETLIEKVTNWPAFEGLLLDVRLVVVLVLDDTVFTVCDKIAEPLPL